MFLNNSQASCNIIQPIPRFYAFRFGRRLKIEDHTNDNRPRESKINQNIQLPTKHFNDDPSANIIITGIRNRDWNLDDHDLQDLNETKLSQIRYQTIPSMSNTIKNHLANTLINNHQNQYEEYDLDEQDFQWLITYNQFRIEKQLPEIDENIFEYIMQLLEQQCLKAIRQKSYEDTIQCDACRRIDDVDDLIQCVQCKSIVHKKCYGIAEHEDQWLCISCQCDNSQHVCCICGENDGIFKILKCSSLNQQWVHLSCSFWFPSIEFDEKMSPSSKDILQDEGTCSICDKANGIKIQCCWKNCTTRFHTRCAFDVEQDMFIAESEDNLSIRLLALCCRHSEKLDLVEKRMRMNKSLEIKQKRFEQFESYVDLDAIKQQTSILPDVVESIHTYWVLKRQANNGQPLIDIPDEVFSYNYDKKVNLKDFARQYHLDHLNTNTIDEKSNMLQFLATDMPTTCSSIINVFVKFARRPRLYFTDYERSRFCLLDAEKRRRDPVFVCKAYEKRYMT
ncbi:unnamed protein product [Adineta ricciae]|uniref:Zinc finger PHD-type domain-containing protein n=1 Tax=Adineta ricciae TaxID=249248 RepID=A0A814WBA6_ADIRI|nr:unnamed protein product [Adineta ricciae]CAF1200081.1 unnamed protein product [Adineta ricciae]